MFLRTRKSWIASGFDPKELRTMTKGGLLARRSVGSFQLSYIPSHLKTGEPFNIAWQIIIGPYARSSFRGRKLFPLFHDLVTSSLLTFYASIVRPLARSSDANVS